jgi:hypothetical protein
LHPLEATSSSSVIMTPLSFDCMGRISLGTVFLEDGKAVVSLSFISIMYSIFMNFFAVEANNTLWSMLILRRSDTIHVRACKSFSLPTFEN